MTRLTQRSTRGVRFEVAVDRSHSHGLEAGQGGELRRTEFVARRSTQFGNIGATQVRHHTIGTHRRVRHHTAIARKYELGRTTRSIEGGIDGNEGKPSGGVAACGACRGCRGSHGINLRRGYDKKLGPGKNPRKISNKFANPQTVPVPTTRGTNVRRTSVLAFEPLFA